MYIKYKLMEENDVDGTLHKWYKQNFFAKDAQNVQDDDIDIKEVFDLTDGDIKKFSSKKKKT